MKVSPRGADAIRAYEGLRLKAYQCDAGVWTIGWGHTGPEVVEGLVWTKVHADAVFLEDVAHRERRVLELLSTKARELLQVHQLDALVSLAFNIGLGEEGFAGSTLLRKLNAGDFKGAACQFVRWHKVRGVLNQGLLLRRASELYTFAGGA